MKVRTAADIGLAIRERRRAAGWDQEALARRAKVSRQWIVEIEKGKPRAEIGLVLRTLEALGLDVSLATAGPVGDAVPSVDIDEILDDLRTDRP